jgi:hypothetical protein
MPTTSHTDCLGRETVRSWWLHLTVW